jgi:hypothetical protein
MRSGGDFLKKSDCMSPLGIKIITRSVIHGRCSTHTKATLISGTTVAMSTSPTCGVNKQESQRFLAEELAEERHKEPMINQMIRSVGTFLKHPKYSSSHAYLSCYRPYANSSLPDNGKPLQ